MAVKTPTGFRGVFIDSLGYPSFSGRNIWERIRRIGTQGAAIELEDQCDSGNRIVLTEEDRSECLSLDWLYLFSPDWDYMEIYCTMPHDARTNQKVLIKDNEHCLALLYVVRETDFEVNWHKIKQVW